jgi:hypothetical protein
VRCRHHRLAERAAQHEVCGAAPSLGAADAAGSQCRCFHCELCGCAGADSLSLEWYSVGRWLVVCAQCVDRTTTCTLPEDVCGGGCGSSRTEMLTADGSRGCRPCAGEMPVHTVWLARATAQLPLALSWVAQSLSEAVPALLPSARSALCVEMAGLWCAAATAALPPPHGTLTAPPAFPGNPTPWSSWWMPTRRALGLPTTADSPQPVWPDCVGGLSRPAMHISPDLWLAPPPVPLPTAAPPRPRPLSLGRATRVRRAPRAATRATRGRGAGSDAPPTAERSVATFFRPNSRPRSPDQRTAREPPPPSQEREGLRRAGRRRSSPRRRRARSSSPSSSSRSTSPRSPPPRRAPRASGAAPPRPSDDDSSSSSDRPRVRVTGVSYGRPVPDPD